MTDQTYEVEYTDVTRMYIKVSAPDPDAAIVAADAVHEELSQQDKQELCVSCEHPLGDNVSDFGPVRRTLGVDYQLHQVLDENGDVVWSTDDDGLSCQKDLHMLVDNSEHDKGTVTVEMSDGTFERYDGVSRIEYDPGKYLRIVLGEGSVITFVESSIERYMFSPSGDATATDPSQEKRLGWFRALVATR